MSEENQVVDDDSQQAEPEPDTGQEPEAADQGGEDNALQEAWEQVAPDLAEHISDLSPEAREGILLKRLAAQTAGAHPNGDQSQGDVADRDAQPQSPPAVDIPSYDPERLVAAAVQALDDGDSEAFGKVMREQFESVNAVIRMVGNAQSEMGVKMDEMGGTFTKAMRPAQFRKVLSDVQGAAESDFAAAESILDSGEAASATSALKLAVFNRQQDISVPQGRASDTARRKAAGVAADRLSGGPRTTGQAVTRIASTDDGSMRELLAKEAEAKNRR